MRGEDTRVLMIVVYVEKGVNQSRRAHKKINLAV